MHLRRDLPDGTTELRALYCKRWTCHYCAHNIQRPSLIHQIERVIQEHDLDQFIVLTLPHKGQSTPYERCRYILKKFALLRAKISRSSEANLSYVWIREMKHGWPHLNLLTRDQDPSWIKQRWHTLTGAHQVSTATIYDAHGLAPYVTKDTPMEAYRYRHDKIIRWCGASQDIKMKDAPVEDNLTHDDHAWKRGCGPIGPLINRHGDVRVTKYTKDGTPLSAILRNPNRL